MPSYFGPVVEDSDDEEEVRRDEYGDLFEDYGFLKRAQDHKSRGNDEYRRERHEKALAEYEKALDCLVTVAHDKSICLGKKKWNDVVVLRSTLHLNKSTCFFKQRQWKPSLDEAVECLCGNVREEQMYTDPHIRQQVKDKDRKNGTQGVTFVEDRLPRATRAKAWFRVSQCYANLEYNDRAKEALAKALEMADDEGLLSELSRHSLKLDVLGKQQKEKQREKFRGFWDKLQERGGYIDKKTEKQAHWDSLNYEQKYAHVTELDDDEEDVPAIIPAQKVPSRPLGQALSRPTAADEKALQELQSRLPPGLRVESTSSLLSRQKNREIDASFDNYLQRKPDLDSSEAAEAAANAAQRPPVVGAAPTPASAAASEATARPDWKEEARLKYEPPKRSPLESADVQSAGVDYAKAWAEARQEADEGEAALRRNLQLEAELDALDDSDHD